MTKPLTLTVCLPQLSTFGKLDVSGNLDNEMSLYRRLQDMGMQVQLFSHGGREELAYAQRMPGMRILCNWLGLPHPRYERRAHLLHAPALLRSDIIMNHKPSALRSTLRAEWAWRIPFVFSSSYHWSTVLGVIRAEESDFIARAEGMERRAMDRAVQVVTSTQDIADLLLKQAPAAAPKVKVIPNFVDTQLFRPMECEKQYDLVYVGRIEGFKNLGALLEAVKQLGITIAIIGGGTVLASGKDHVKDEEMRLQQRFGDLDGRIHWLGRVKNEQLPPLINQGRAFAMSSLREGHPRAMIEAMACGMPIIGTRVFGIRSVLQHGVTGYLCETDSDSLVQAIETVLAQPELMRTLGDNARQYALQHYSLPELAQAFHDLLQDVAQRHPASSPHQRLARYVVRRR